MPHMNTSNKSNKTFLKVLASPFTKFTQALSVGEDYWTWMTLDGQAFEDVEILKIDREEVKIRHKYGVASLLKTELSKKIQQSLRDNVEYVESYESKGYLPTHGTALSKAA